MFTRLSALFTALLVLRGSFAYPNPGKVTGAYAGVHDPSKLCKDSSGKYFIFSTGGGLNIRTSTDRIDFTSIGNVFPKGGYSWTDSYTGTSNGDLWAPDCTFVNGQFYLYYAASSFGSRNSAIFLATSKTGAPGSWTHQGLVISTTTSSAYNAIDPNLIIDNGAWWLNFGSFGSGIQLVQLNSGTGKPSGSIQNIAKRGGTEAIEAPGILKYGSYYYLFSSWDKCCSGTSSTYNIRVGRAASITGPYKDQAGVALTSGGGTLILASHDSIIGPGGQSVYQDTDAVVLVYHWYTSTTSNLGINLLDFSSGWPVVY